MAAVSARALNTFRKEAKTDLTAGLIDPTLID